MRTLDSGMIINDSFTHSSIHRFSHSFINSFIHSFLHSFLHTISPLYFSQLPIVLFHGPSFKVLTHPFIHSFIYSFIGSFIHSLINSCQIPNTILNENEYWKKSSSSITNLVAWKNQPRSIAWAKLCDGHPYQSHPGSLHQLWSSQAWTLFEWAFLETALRMVVRI